MPENKSIYLDYQASTPLSEKAREAMKYAGECSFANPHSSDHAQGWEAAKIVENASHDIADFIGGLGDEIVFVSGATEANNIAIIGTGLSAYKRNDGRKKIIISEIEHKCILGAARFLEENFDFKVVKVPVKNDGTINLESLRKAVDQETLIVSVMAVNNEIGTTQPIKKIGEVCKKAGAIFHVDAAQALYTDIDVMEDGIDLLSLSSHKLYGPKGIGALYISQFIEMEPTPLFQGGGQQKGYRSGTVPTDLTAGFAAAIKELTELKEGEISRLESLKNFAWEELKKSFPSIRLNGSWENRHPGNINVTFPAVDAKALIGNLQPIIAVSTGSACTSGIPEPSHVLRAIGLSTADAESSIRLSIGRMTTKKEVETAVKKIVEAARAYKAEFLKAV